MLFPLKVALPRPSPRLFVPSRATVVRYAAALAIVAIALVLRLWLDPFMGNSGFAISLTGMLLAAWVGGLGPSLISSTLILFVTALWFAPQHRGHSPMTVQGIVTLVAFYSVGGIVGSLSEAWRASRDRLRGQTEEALSQRERMRAILTCMADGVLVTDIDGRLTMMNPMAEEMTGWKLEEATGKSVLDVFVVSDEQEQLAAEDPVGRVLRNQLVLQKLTRLMLTDRFGHRLPVSYSAAPIYNGDANVKGIVIIIRDETDRREVEQQLRDADRRKDEFLATLAHELRNPLAPIAMGLQLLQEGDDDPESTDEIVTLMDRQARHMVRLIDDLLDVSRITRGKLELRREHVLAADVVQGAVETVRPALEEAGHEFSLELPDHPVMIDADPNRLTQVLSNLLDNAVKYTPAGGQVEMVAAIEGGQLVVTVSDSGCGIPAEKLGTIFEMFMQVKGKMENGHKGLGIGLTLVKQLVEMHGGRIEVESAGIDQGSRFRVSLPIVIEEILPQQGSPHPLDAPPVELPAVDQNSAQLATAGAHPTGAARRVLVVDDNADALRSLSLLVSRLGNETHQARDGVEAVEAVERLSPDVVLMDIGMPRLNGYDAARQIRQQPWGSSLLLVATTGWGQEDDRRRTKEAGFDHHLVKPIDARQLKDLLGLLPPSVKTHVSVAPRHQEGSGPKHSMLLL